MRRILIAIGTTLAGLVLLFSFPTSLNRIAAANAIGAAAAGTTTAAGTSTADATAATAAADAATAQAAADAAAATAAADSNAATAAADAAAAQVAADAAAAAQAAADAAAAAAAASPVTFDGAVASTRYGNVQVRITVANGVVMASDAIAAPSGDRKSVQITSYAVPILNQEAVATSSAKIAMVSGATYTSGGYVQSLQSALDQAGL